MPSTPNQTEAKEHPKKASLGWKPSENFGNGQPRALIGRAKRPDEGSLVGVPIAAGICWAAHTLGATYVGHYHRLLGQLLGGTRGSGQSALRGIIGGGGFCGWNLLGRACAWRNLRGSHDDIWLNCVMELVGRASRPDEGSPVGVPIVVEICWAAPSLGATYVGRKPTTGSIA